MPWGFCSWAFVQQSLQKHNEKWKECSDKEGNLDVKIQEGVIGYEIPRQYPAQYFWEGYTNLKTI